MKRVTVVTVTYNCKSHLENTIKSVIEQTYPNKEYIIIDGASSDGTVELVKEYISYIKYFVSETDAGVFDAMNKALNHASGEYILFMNAGDRFVDRNIIARIFNDYVGDDDLIYGDVFIENSLGKKKHSAKAIYETNFTPQDLVFKSQGFCHQSLFTKLDILKEVKFDLRFPIGADYYATYSVFMNGNHKLRYVGFPVSIFNAMESGVSHTGNFMKEIYVERCIMFGYPMKTRFHIRLAKMKIIHSIKSFLFSTFPRTTKKIRLIQYERTCL